MAHTCPECGHVCRCSGDTDNVHVDGETSYDWSGCTHCPPDGESDEEDDDEPEFDRYNRLIKPLDRDEEDGRWNYVERTVN